jgi:hypothetical protein
VSTGEVTVPARRLYEGEGFRVVETLTFADGLRVARLAHDADTAGAG